MVKYIKIKQCKFDKFSKKYSNENDIHEISHDFYFNNIDKLYLLMILVIDVLKTEVIC